jgi:pimeloyl-ACP methyl ester carboxylesterase
MNSRRRTSRTAAVTAESQPIPTDMPAVDGVKHRFVDVGGTRLHVAEAGDGPPLLLLHGWPQHWWCWRYLLGPLAQTYRVLAPDLRGWGWSDAPSGSYDKLSFAHDVIGLLDAEGLDSVSVVGHDWGGFTAFLLGIEHPDRLERIVNLDIAPPWMPPPRPRHALMPSVGTYAVAVATPGIGPLLMTASGAFIEAVIRGGSTARRWSTEELDCYASVLRQPARARASSACYRTFLTRELLALASGRYGADDLGVDTLLVLGQNSPMHRVLRPQSTSRMTVEVIEGAGHFLPEEAPEAVLRHITRFLTPAT